MKQKKLKFINYKIYKYEINKKLFVFSVNLRFKLGKYKFEREFLYRDNLFFFYESLNSFSAETLEELNTLILKHNSVDYSKYIPDEFFTNIMTYKFIKGE